MFVLCTDPGLWSSVICGEMIVQYSTVQYSTVPGAVEQCDLWGDDSRTISASLLLQPGARH